MTEIYEEIVTAKSAEDMLQGKWKSMRPLIKCKDCKWRESEPIPNRKTLWWCNKLEMSVGKYDYCSWGERREDD